MQLQDVGTTTLMVADDGAEAAWQIVQHAILDPDLQRRAVGLLDEAVKAGEAPAWQWAMLTDRVLIDASQPQIYGSIFVGGADGGLIPCKNVWTRRFGLVTARPSLVDTDGPVLREDCSRVCTLARVPYHGCHLI